MQLYDHIGKGYRSHRRPDARIERQILRALGDARSVVNVGAGSGSYEPRDRDVVAVEPSQTMIAQRPAWSAPVVAAAAESLPFRDRSFDAALAVLTVHHWSDRERGVAEMRRVAARLVVLAFEPLRPGTFWFADEYVPEVFAITEAEPAASWVASVIGPHARLEVVPVPCDCADGFFASYWARPEAYLDPQVCASISALARLDERTVRRARRTLEQDLRSGAWDERHGHLRERDSMDYGYRLVVA